MVLKNKVISLITLFVLLVIVPSVSAASAFDSVYDAAKTDSTGNKNKLSDVAQTGKVPSQYASFGFGKFDPTKTVKYSGITSTAGSYTVANQSTRVPHDGWVTVKIIFEDSTPTLVPSTADISGGVGNLPEYSACFPQVGEYNGTSIDVKATVKGFDVDEIIAKKNGKQNNGNPYWYVPVMAFSGYSGTPSVQVAGLDYVDVEWAFFKSDGNCTGQVATGLKGHTSYWDVDNQQGIGFVDNTSKGLYISSTSNVLRYKSLSYNSANMNTVFTEDSASYGSENKDHAFTEVFDTGSGNTIRRLYIYREADGTSVGGMGNEYTPVIPVDVPEPSKTYASDTPSGANHAAVKVGDTIKYQIKYANGDQDNSVSVVIKDTLSKGLEYVAGSAKIGSSAVNPTVTNNSDGTTLLTWNTTLAKGSNATLTYSAKVTSAAQTIVNNSAKVTIGDHEYTLAQLKNPVPTKSYASDTPSGANHAAVVKGNNIKYSIKYTNVSDKTSTVKITDTISKGLTYNGDAKVGGTAVTPTVTNNSDGSTTLVFTKTIAAGASEELKYSAKVTGATTVVQNNAKIQYDNNPAIDLNILKNPVPSKTYGGSSLSDNAGWDHHEVKTGNDIKYKIKLANVKSSAQTVVVTDVLSKGLTYNNDVRATNGTVTNTLTPNVNSDTKKTTLVWTISIPAGQTAEVTYSAKVNKDAVNLVNNSASCKYGTEASIKLAELHNPVNVKEYASDTPSGMNGSLVQKGDTIKYSVSYANPYDSAQKITIKDTISKGLEYTEKTAKVCKEAEGKRTCEDLTDEVVTKNEDGTTTMVWTRASVASHAFETIEYSVLVTGETVKVQNNAMIKYGDNPYVNINQLKNPVPVKSYDAETPFGLNGAAVAKGNKIRYNISYANIYDSKVTATIKDTISDGITYVKGTSKVGDTVIEDPAISEDGKTLTWTRELEKNVEEELTYEVIVTGETKIVNNKASMIYSNNPSVEKFLNELYNPVPQKEYAKDTKAGKNGATVKKDDVISYSISYANVKETKETVIITDTINNGLTYEKGTAKINGKAKEPDSITKDENGTTLIWMVEAEQNSKNELVYGARVTGTTKVVKNNASIQYGNDPAIKLNELRNPLIVDEIVNVPDTASTIAVAGVVAGVLLVSGGGYLVYRRYKKA